MLIKDVGSGKIRITLLFVCKLLIIKNYGFKQIYYK